MHCTGCRKTLCSDCAFPNPLPKSKLQWCCIKPQIKSENGLIEFSDRSINLGPAPLPMGQGYEDPDFCPQQEKVIGPLQEALRFEKDARISMRWLEGNRRPDKRCPRNLCSDCYQSKGWRVSCQTCNQELCIAHDLRNSNPQVCGYLGSEIAKGKEAVMGTMHFDEAVETGETLPLEYIFAQQVTEDCRNKIGGAEKELLERVRILRECYDQIPNVGYIKWPNIITADLRQELDKLFPSTQDTFDTLQIASPSETPHSVEPLPPAIASLIQVVIAAKEHCHRAAERRESLKNARLSFDDQFDSLRVLCRALASNLAKYDCDVERSLSESDRDAIRNILQEINQIAGKCERIVVRLRRAINRSGNHRTELDIFRKELDTAVPLIQKIFRRVSESNPNNETQIAAESSFRQQSAVDSRGIPPSEMESGGLHRQDTSWSAQTLMRSPTSASTTGSSTSSSTRSIDSTRTLLFVEIMFLRSAIEEDDLSWVQRLIREGTNVSEIESRKASALLLACCYRRKEIVRFLLSSHTAIDLTDDEGLGVLHHTIGKSDILYESVLRNVLDILRVLVEHNARVSITDKSRKLPLHYCAMTGNYRAAKYLLRVAPDVVNLADGDRMTALYHACVHHSPNEKLVKLLLSKGATFGTRGRPSLTKVRYQRTRRMLDEAQQEGRRLTER
ncbi:MAG: hypothetical protein Q9164_003298 [Protoblastenia rupestris]